MGPAGAMAKGQAVGEFLGFLVYQVGMRGFLTLLGVTVPNLLGV